MGMVMTVHAIDDEMLRRVTEPRPRRGFFSRLRGGSGVEDSLLDDIEEQCEDWWPERGDGKSWDVIHWTLMGRGSGSDTTDMFGADPTGTRDLAEWSGTLDPDAVVALASALERVDEDVMRQRLANVPEDLYWAETFGSEEEHDDVIADARDLVVFARMCADRRLGLLITVN